MVPLRASLQGVPSVRLYCDRQQQPLVNLRALRQLSIKCQTPVSTLNTEQASEHPPSFYREHRQLSVHRTEFLFDDGINIVIGPNGGGKSNLQRVLALTLSKYVIHQYAFKRNDKDTGIAPLDPWTQNQLRRELAPYLGHEHDDQSIEIELSPDPADMSQRPDHRCQSRRLQRRSTFRA